MALVKTAKRATLNRQISKNRSLTKTNKWMISGVVLAVLVAFVMFWTSSSYQNSNVPRLSIAEYKKEFMKVEKVKPTLSNKQYLESISKLLGEIAQYKTDEFIDFSTKITNTFIESLQKSCIELVHDTCKSEQIGEALHYIRANRKLYSNLPHLTVFRIGYIFQFRDNFEEASKIYLECSEFEASALDCLSNLAIVYRFIGHKDIAAVNKKRSEYYINAVWVNNRGNNKFCESKYDVKGVYCDDWSYFNSSKSIKNYKSISSFEELAIEENAVISYKNNLATDNVEIHCQPRRGFAKLTLQDVYLQDRSLTLFSKCEFWMCGHRKSHTQTTSTQTDLWAPRKEVHYQRAFVLPYKHATNYYHFLIEGLSNLIYYLDNDKTTDKILLYASSQNGVVFSYELTLILTNVYKNLGNRIEWIDERQRYFINELTLIDWFSDNTDLSCSSYPKFQESFQQYYPPASLLQSLQRALIAGLKESEVPKRINIVYVSREKSPRNDRKIINEDLFLVPLAAGLKEMNEKEGTNFHLVVHRGNENLREQIKEFRAAAIVIGGHGAGLSNILFCQKGTMIIEFPTIETVNEFFEYEAAALDLPYFVAPQFAMPLHGNYVVSDKDRKFIVFIVNFIISSLAAFK